MICLALRNWIKMTLTFALLPIATGTQLLVATGARLLVVTDIRLPVVTVVVSGVKGLEVEMVVKIATTQGHG